MSTPLMPSGSLSKTGDKIYRDEANVAWAMGSNATLSLCTYDNFRGFSSEEWEAWFSQEETATSLEVDLAVEAHPAPRESCPYDSPVSDEWPRKPRQWVWCLDDHGSFVWENDQRKWEMKTAECYEREMNEYHSEVLSFKSRTEKKQSVVQENSGVGSWVDVQECRSQRSVSSTMSKRKAFEAVKSFSDLQTALIDNSSDIDDATWEKVCEAHRELMTVIEGVQK